MAALSQLEQAREYTAGISNVSVSTSVHMTHVFKQMEVEAMQAEAIALVEARAQAEVEAREAMRAEFMQQWVVATSITNSTTNVTSLVLSTKPNWYFENGTKQLNGSMVYDERSFNATFFHATLNETSLLPLLDFVYADFVQAFVQGASEEVYFHCLEQARLESLNVTLPREEPPMIEPFSYLLLVAGLLIFCGIGSCCIQCLRFYWFSKAKYRIHNEHMAAKLQAEIEESHMTTFRSKGGRRGGAALDKFSAQEFGDDGDSDDEATPVADSAMESHRLAKSMTKAGANKSQILTELGKADPGSIVYHKEMQNLYSQVDEWQQMKELTTKMDEKPSVVKSRKHKRSNYHNYGNKGMYSKDAKKKRRDSKALGGPGKDAAVMAMEAAKLRAGNFARSAAHEGMLRSVIDPQTGRKLVLPPVYSLPVAK